MRPSPPDRAARPGRSVRSRPAGPGGRWLPVVLGLGLSTVQAQTADGAGAARGWRIEPQVSVTETFTDNYRLVAQEPASDAVTRLTAGIGLRGQTGLLRGFLDYNLSSLLHARHSQANTYQNALNSALSAELADGRLRLEAAAGISQNAISAFGLQSGNSGLNAANTTEVRTLRLAPTLQGLLGPALRYNASLAYQATDASGSRNGDSATTTAAIHLEPQTAGRVGLALDASHLASDFKAGRSTVSDRVFGTARYTINDLDLRLSANAGVESTDMASLRRQRHGTWGIGWVWEPSPRTRLSGDWERRFFGTTHALSLEHRTPLTVWRLSDSRSLNTSGGGAAGGVRGTAFDLFFSQFASIEPDPLKRADLVNAFLRSNGIDPGLNLQPGFLRSSATVQDRQEFSVAMRGVRSAAVLTASRSATRRVDTSLSLGDDLDGGRVTLRLLALDLSHRLTPDSSVTLLLSRQQGGGNLANQTAQTTRQQSFNLGYTTRLGPTASLALGLRRALYENASGAYDENALFATYGLRF